jgi:hypothetical protein
MEKEKGREGVREEYERGLRIWLTESVEKREVYIVRRNKWVIQRVKRKRGALGEVVRTRIKIGKVRRRV